MKGYRLQPSTVAGSIAESVVVAPKPSSTGIEPAPPPASRVVPSLLLPVWLPLIGAAIVSGALLAWLVPVSDPDGTPPAARFTDITTAAGITFRHRAGTSPSETPTTIGGGVVFFDYDADGDPDLFFVNGTDWPWEHMPARRPNRSACALYRNDGSGRFTDVSAYAGLNIEFQGMAAAAGDYDNDGFPDLFVTGVGSNHLFRNRGDGRFEDVTEDAGLLSEDNTWSTGATWIDIDGDGWLDLVVCHYARWPREVGLDGAFSVALMGHSYGAPTGFFSTPPTVYRNLGDGRFSVVPGSAGLVAPDTQTGRPVGHMVAVIPGDANNDGRLDLLFASHTHPGVLFLNDDNGGFRLWSAPEQTRREGASAGIASASSLTFLPSGGIDERLALLHERTLAASLEESPSLRSLDSMLGAAVLDYDRDGRLDLIESGGFLEAEVNRFPTERELRGVPRLLWQRADRAWVLAPPATDGVVLPPVTGRGVAVADIDGDGDLDVVISQHNGPPILLRNDQRTDVPWLAFDLVATRGAREAGGARVEVHTPRRIQVQTCAPAMGLMAQSTSTLFFGLGEDARVRRIVVIWPDGTRQELRPEGLNRRITLRQP